MGNIFGIYEHSYYKYLELWGNFYSGPLFHIYIKKYLPHVPDSKCAKSSNALGTREKFSRHVWIIFQFCRYFWSKKYLSIWTEFQQYVRIFYVHPSMNFLKSTKIALSYREIISMCPVIMWIIPRDCLDPKNYFLYA